MEGDLRARVERLEREQRELRDAVRLLHRVAHLVRTSLELEPTIYAILTGTTAGEGLGMNRAMLFLRDGAVLRGAGAVGPRDREEADRVWRAIEAEKPDLTQLYEAGLRQLERRDEHTLDARVRETEVPLEGDSPIARAVRHGRLVVGEGSDDLGGLLDLPTGIAAPLRDATGALGVLFADNRFTGRTLGDTTLLITSMVADHAARALEVARQYEQVAERARIDALTGLPHHGALMTELAEAVAQANAAGAELGVLMIDVDDFKRINDERGHPVGDAVLAHLAARVKGVVRHPEHVYRYGGEELTVLVPELADASEAATVAERIRAAVAERPFPADGGAVTVTCSIGAATQPTHGASAEALLRAADEALLSAKRAGKNRVVTA